ncbi:hypothetical protein IV203_018874 [Nitzschia inconspicua]|uniref:Uncharacterized protein n=1 Tax=Nitzschia inconspicua TaxID=303405 RepID=A0A9K3Q6S4_9STRA|nr:hypothetical protein IV203_018874 [Nitzschia inconspicua]
MEDENNVKESMASTTEEPEEEIMTMTMLLSEPLPPPKGIADKLAILKHHITTLESRTETFEQKYTILEDQFTTLEDQIGDVEKQMDDKEKEIESTTPTGNNDVANMTTEELLEYYQKRDHIYQKQTELRKEKQNILQKQIELRKEQTELRKEEQNISQKHHDLQIGFLKGEYYAWTSEVWKIEEVTRKGKEWQSFVRSLKDDIKFQCRYPKKTSDDDDDKEANTPDPYNATINGAQNSNCAVPNSDTTSTSSSLPQSDTATTTDAIVWPKDIFGNQLQTQAIAHLVPARKSVSHKQWLNVAAAVLGIPSTATLNVKKKAARGFFPEEEKHVGGTQSESNSDNTKVTKRRKMPGTGVIHFVTNKIRFDKQKTRLDGQDPTVLIVPVMTLDDAKNWRGEGYSAICLAGYPSGKEVNIACDFLRAAVLALHDMIANLSQDELTLGVDPNHKANTLLQASEKARDLLCKVPGPITPLGEKPVCLITFGGHEDVDMHPAPDPLLLVLKAANIFGIMAGMTMLANGPSDDDSDISMGDIIEEEAFLEARERALRPQTWEDLARGLGQPNGYVA